jgi:hypothetical protein
MMILNYDDIKNDNGDNYDNSDDDYKYESTHDDNTYQTLDQRQPWQRDR